MMSESVSSRLMSSFWLCKQNQHLNLHIFMLLLVDVRKPSLCLKGRDVSVLPWQIHLEMRMWRKWSVSSSNTWVQTFLHSDIEIVFVSKGKKKILKFLSVLLPTI